MEMAEKSTYSYIELVYIIYEVMKVAKADLEKNYREKTYGYLHNIADNTQTVIQD